MVLESIMIGMLTSGIYALIQQHKDEFREAGLQKEALREEMQKDLRHGLQTLFAQVTKNISFPKNIDPDQVKLLKVLFYAGDGEEELEYELRQFFERGLLGAPPSTEEPNVDILSAKAIEKILKKVKTRKNLKGLANSTITGIIPRLIVEMLIQIERHPGLKAYANVIRNVRFGRLLQQIWDELRIKDSTQQKAIEQARIRLLRHARDIFNIKLAGARREFIGHFKYISPNLRRVKKINGRYPSDYRQEENTEPIDFASLMTLAIKTQRVLIIAPAGVGKTIFLRRLHLDLLEKGLAQAPLPIFMHVDDFLKSRPNFTETVSKKLETTKAINYSPEKAGQITNALYSQGRLCFVLDSLDQSSNFAGINACFGTEASECVDRNIVVVACRTEQIDSRSSRGIEDHHQDFQEFEWVLLDEFTEKQLQDEYLGEEALAWLDFDNLSENFKELLRTGYYANIAKCLGLEGDKDKPVLKTKTDLLDKFIKHLFREAGRRRLDLGHEDIEIKKFLGRLSFDTLCKEYRQVFPVDFMEKNQYDTKAWAILKKITEAQWIYRRLFEGKPETQYTFYHQLLQEYFAACHLKKLFETDQSKFEKALVVFPFSEVVWELLDELLTDHEEVFEFCKDHINQALAEADGQKVGLPNTGHKFTWLLALRDKKGEQPELAVKLQEAFDDELKESQDTETNGKFVKIRAGAFLMGSYEYGWEQPVRVVYLSDFWISKYAETFEEFDRFCLETGKEKPPDKRDWGRKRRPVIYVSWDDAKDYIKWLEDGSYLPREAQWEKASRGCLGRRYPWGNEADTSKAHYNKSLSEGTVEVKSKSYAPQMYGLHQMSGNVWEWCEDYLADDYREDPVTDPTGPLEGSGRVFRGGGWNYYAGFCRCADRYGRGPGSRDDYLGFRLARIF